MNIKLFNELDEPILANKEKHITVLMIFVIW